MSLRECGLVRHSFNQCGAIEPRSHVAAGEVSGGVAWRSPVPPAVAGSGIRGDHIPQATQQGVLFVNSHLLPDTV